MSKNRVLIGIRGGCLESVKADRPDEIAVDLLDYDNVIPEQEGRFGWTFPVERLTQEAERHGTSCSWPQSSRLTGSARRVSNAPR
jgi:hypothetical protein